MSIRADKKELTRERIMRGLAEALLESPPHEVSIQAVADRAGVSHRTVYRYFDTKDDLFQAYGEWIDEVTNESGREVTVPRSLRELEDQVLEYTKEFDEHADLMEAYVRIGKAGHDMEVQDRRTEAFREIVRDALPDLDPEYRAAIAALVRQICSSQTWSRAREDFDVDGETLGEATSWLLENINDVLEEDGVPDSWKRED